MIPRYTRPDMGSIWTDQNKFQKWLEVEIATAEVEAEEGLIPKSAARAIRRKARFEVERILEIERRVKHDVIAFTTNVAEHIGKEGRYLHYGLTSNDVVVLAECCDARSPPTHRAHPGGPADLPRVHAASGNRGVPRLTPMTAAKAARFRGRPECPQLPQAGRGSPTQA